MKVHCNYSMTKMKRASSRCRPCATWIRKFPSFIKAYVGIENIPKNLTDAYGKSAA
jgi:hypothetical protein